MRHISKKHSYSQQKFKLNVLSKIPTVIAFQINKVIFRFVDTNKTRVNTIKKKSKQPAQELR